MAKVKLELDDEEFPSNDKKSKKTAPIRDVEIVEEGRLIEEPVKAKRVARGVVIKKRKSITRSIADTFFGESAKEVGSHILMEVLVPAAKNMIQDMVTQGIERFLYGDDGVSSRRSRDRGEATKVSYGKYYSSDSRDRRPKRRDRFEIDEIYFPSSEQATDVLEELSDELERYKQITVAEYLSVAGVDNEYGWPANKWGWTDLEDARCRHTRYGWMITLPPPEELRD